MNVALEGAHGLKATGATRRACLAVAFFLISTAAFAQSGNSGFDVRQTERRFDALQREQQRPGADSLMPVNPDTGGVGSSSAQKKLFVLRGVRLSGAHALPQEALANSYRDYLDKSISEADLARIADGITGQYRAAGYHLSRAIVPPQDVAGGRIKIQVIEGRITDVVIHGDRDGRFDLQSFAKPVLAARPSRQDVLERQLLLIGARPGVQVRDTALDEIGLATGNFRLIVHVKTWQAYAASGIDNLGSSSVGPWQSYATTAFHSYLTAGDAAIVNLSTTPADRRQLGFARMAYDAPVGSDGISVGATALYSNVRPGDWRSELNDVTKTRSFEFRGRVNPIQSRNLSMFLTTALAFTDVSEKDVLGDIYRDRLRILSLTSDYRFKDLFDANSYLTLSFRQGLGGLGASQYGDAFLSRANASGEFSSVNLWFTRYQPLAEAWSLKISSAVQYASAELLTSQQFYVGGASFGRGYDSAEFGGDNAVAGSIELRFDHSFEWPPVVKGIQVYGFVDHGAVWNVGYGHGDGLSLASAGGGLRIFFDKDIRADIGVGMPLTYRSPDNFSRSPRFLFSLSNALQFCPPKIDRCP